jgi:hypothetical protein
MAPPPELAVTRIAPACCATETGGAVILLVLTSVRTDWLPAIGEVMRNAATHAETGRAAVLSVFCLDKRYPLDIGFDTNLHELRQGHRDFAPFIGASSVVLEFGGALAFTMKAAIATMGLFVKEQYPQAVHTSVVAATSWLLPYVDESRRRDIAHYTEAIDRLRMALGCTPH